MFIEHRLKKAAAPTNLFENDAIDIIAASTRGNQRPLVNIATMALEEAYDHDQKTITAETLHSSE